MFTAYVLGLGLPRGIDSRNLFVIGCAGSIGFTVALFVAGVAFPLGAVQDAAKMGALLSFAGALTAALAAFILGVKPITSFGAEAEPEHDPSSAQPSLGDPSLLTSHPADSKP
jgi:NhaA family Na+:H+ antiporter